MHRFSCPWIELVSTSNKDDGARPMTHDADKVAVNLISWNMAITPEKISDGG
jgi:hypothetical protein